MEDLNGNSVFGRFNDSRYRFEIGMTWFTFRSDTTMDRIAGVPVFCNI